jgi:hypothetical protein
VEERFTESRRPVVPPAVGEKNSDEADLPGGVPPGACAKGLAILELPIGAAARWSRDMVELAPTTLYMPRFFPGTADMVLISAMFWAIAARLTERCSDHATRPRHASTAAAKKARIAPTQIKTVPSGRSDFCMKAAPAVSGTFMMGTPTPARVGRPSRGATFVGFVPTVGKSVLVVGLGAAELGVVAVDLGAADDVADCSPWPSGAERLARSGKPLFCARAEGATASSRPTRAIEGRIVECVQERKVKARRRRTLVVVLVLVLVLVLEQMRVGDGAGQGLTPVRRRGSGGDGDGDVDGCSYWEPQGKRGDSTQVTIAKKEERGDETRDKTRQRWRAGGVQQVMGERRGLQGAESRMSLWANKA